MRHLIPRRRFGGGAILHVVVLAACLHAAAAPSHAQLVAITGGPVTLRVNSAVAGSDPTPVSDQTTQLDYTGGGGVPNKITIETACPGQAFSLYARANVTSGGGTALPEVTVTQLTVQDLVRDIPGSGGASTGVAKVRYRAAPTAAQGNSTVHGDDAHLITYTILNQ